MRLIGQSNTGGTIIELTREESQMLTRCQGAIQGQQWWQCMGPSPLPMETDMCPLFRAFGIWAGNMMNVNMLEKSVRDLREALGNDPIRRSGETIPPA